jgi:hypothetical protein
LLCRKILDVTSTPFGSTTSPANPASSGGLEPSTRPTRREFSSLQEHRTASTFASLERSDALAPTGSAGLRDSEKENRRPLLGPRASLGSETAASTLKRKNLVEDNSWLSLERKKNPRGGSELGTLERRPTSVSPLPGARRALTPSLDRDGDAKPRRFTELLSNSKSSSNLTDTLRQISDPSLAKRQPQETTRLGRISRSRSRSDNEEDEVESQHGEDFGDLSRARSFWKNLDSETVRKTSIESSTLSRRHSQDASRSTSVPVAAVSSSRSSQPVRPERKNSGLMAADTSRRSSINGGQQQLSGTATWRAGTGSSSSRPEPMPDYEDSGNNILQSKSVITSRRDEERRSRSLEKKFSTVGSASGRKDASYLADDSKQGDVGRSGGSLPRAARSLRRASIVSDAPSYDDRSKSPDYNRGNRRDSLSADRSRRNSRDSGPERRGSTAMDMDYDRGRRDYPIVKRGSTGGLPDDFGPREVMAVGRRGSGPPGESKHFLSLQIFSKVFF